MRIVGGIYRGKKLSAAGKSITRPTADRAKESLFNILNHQLCLKGQNWSGVSFADVFAGSGAIGIEAASRGAKRVCFFENNPLAKRHIKKNIQNISAEFLFFADALTPPKALSAVNIYFSDAPYGQHLTEAALIVFYKEGWIDRSTQIITETETGEKLVFPPPFCVVRQVVYGRNMFSFIKLTG